MLSKDTEKKPRQKIKRSLTNINLANVKKVVKEETKKSVRGGNVSLIKTY